MDAMKPQNAMKHRKPPGPEARSLTPDSSETVPSPLDPPEGTVSSPSLSPPLGGVSPPEGTSEGVERAPPADPELVKKAEERDLYRNELLRARADLENALKRMHRERQQAQDEAMRRFVADLLPV